MKAEEATTVEEEGRQRVLEVLLGRLTARRTTALVRQPSLVAVKGRVPDLPKTQRDAGSSWLEKSPGCSMACWGRTGTERTAVGRRPGGSTAAAGTSVERSLEGRTVAPVDLGEGEGKEALPLQQIGWCQSPRRRTGKETTYAALARRSASQTQPEGRLAQTRPAWLRVTEKRAKI